MYRKITEALWLAWRLLQPDVTRRCGGSRLLGCFRRLAPAPEWDGDSDSTVLIGGSGNVSMVENPLVVDGTVIAPRGSNVTDGRQIKGGRIKGRAHIALRVVDVTTASGELKNIATNTIWHEARDQEERRREGWDLEAEQARIERSQVAALSGHRRVPVRAPVELRCWLPAELLR